MDPQEVRALIGALNQDLGVAFATGVLAGIRLGLTCGGSPCAACDEVDPHITYRIGDVAIRFHAECARVWDEERTKVHRRA